MKGLSVLPIFLIPVCGSIAEAQVVSATLYATVLDPNSAVVLNAKVTALNTDRGSSATAVTAAAGEAALYPLPVGDYTVTVEAPGFKSLRRSGISLSAGQVLRMTFVLELGQVTETVTVSGEAPLLNTVNAEQRTNVEQTQVKELPIFRRDWTNLLNLSTGAQASGGNIRMNGLAPASFRLTVDGTDATQDNEQPSFSMSGNFNFIKGVATEAIAEVNLAKGIASAEIGNTMSGNVNIITKSGTNEFHGSLFWLNNTENFNARNQFLRNKPNLVYNQYGGSLGGPVVRNKAFFFGAFEGYRQRGFQALNEQVPTPEFRARIGAATRIYDKMFSAFPLPNQSYNAASNTGAWIGSGTEQGKDDHAVVRGDVNLRSSDILSIRYTRSRPYRLTPRVVEANNRTWIGTIEQGTVNYTHVMPSWTFETRFGYNYNRVPRDDNYYHLYASDSSYNGISGLGFGVSAETLEREGYTWSIEESIGKTVGRHSMKFGFLYFRPHVRRDNTEVPVLTFSSVQDMISNVPNAGRVTLGVDQYDLRTLTLGFFLQDDFRVNQRLVVNMGVRWDYFGVPKERDGRLFNREQPFGTGPYRDPDSIWDSDWNNFSPRLGFAYTLTPQGKTVLRGGAGMFHSPIPLYAGGVDMVRNAPDEPFRVNYNRTEALQAGDVFRWPVVNEKVRAFVKGLPTLIGDTAANTDFPQPFSYQWNLGVQHEMPFGFVLDTAYVGTRGVHLQMVRFWNQVDRITGRRPYPGFTEFRYRDGADSTAYHSWQTSLRRRLSGGLAFGAAYTYASAFSYTGDADLLLPTSVQDIYNVRDDKAPPGDYLRHAFAGDFVYELPLARFGGSGTRLRRNLLAGWQISGILTARSGNPVTINHTTAFAGSRADYIGGDPVVPGFRETLRHLNRAAFALVPIGAQSGVPIRPGNSGRSNVRGIGWWSLDASLAKRLFLTERVQGKVEAQMLNSLNQTNLSGLENRVNQSNFGYFTSTRGARVVQINVRLDF